MATCFVTRKLPGPALDRLAAAHEVDLWPGQLPPRAADLRARTAQAEGLLCLLTDRVDEEFLAACPDLRVISNYAVGFDNVDVAAARARGIPVGHTPDVLTQATADATFALVLAAARRILDAHDSVLEGRWLTWEPGAFLGADVHRATLGIVGLGRIGRAVARRAEGFDMEVLHHSRSGGIPLEELLERADFVTLHCALTPETRGLIGAAELARMKPTAYLVNTARGPLVQTSALERALHAGTIAGAALDVTDPEPMPRTHPLLGAPNLLVLPHVGSATRAARELMSELAVDNLLAGLAGETLPHAAT
jgi:glyoxylate reductase